MSLKLILKKRLEKKTLNVYVVFVDLEETFDNVKWMRMFEILKKNRIKFEEKISNIWNLL